MLLKRFGDKMYGRHNAVSSYGKIANAETNPLQQIVMLYDGAIKFARLAAADIASGDLAMKAEHSNRALDIISYLQSILDFERGGEVAPILDAFYRNVTATILLASAKLDAELMNRAAETLAPVRDAWATNASSANASNAAANEITPSQNPAPLRFAV
jgi:flagellar protein FliS